MKILNGRPALSKLMLLLVVLGASGVASGEPIASASIPASMDRPFPLVKEFEWPRELTAEEERIAVESNSCFAAECASALRCTPALDMHNCLPGYSWEWCDISPPIKGACLCRTC